MESPGKSGVAGLALLVAGLGGLQTNEAQDVLKKLHEQPGATVSVQRGDQDNPAVPQQQRVSAAGVRWDLRPETEDYYNDYKKTQKNENKRDFGRNFVPPPADIMEVDEK